MRGMKETNGDLPTPNLSSRVNAGLPKLTAAGNQYGNGGAVLLNVGL